VALLSGGKDSTYATYLAILQGFDVSAAVTFAPPEDAMLFHHPNTHCARVIAKALGLEHTYIPVGANEVEALTTYLERANADWLVTGAVASEYQRFLFNMAAESVGMQVYSPLWHVEQGKLVKQIVKDGFRFIIVFAGIENMEQWLGKEITEENVQDLISFMREAQANVSGEGGEYETVVTALPGVRFSYSGRRAGKYFVIDKMVPEYIHT